MNSIRQRLLVWLLTIILFAAATAGLGVYLNAQQEANSVFDHHLYQVAMTLLDQPFEDEDILGTLGQESQFDLVIQVWTEDGVRRYFSRTHVDLPRASHAGYETVKTREGGWRVFSLVRDGLIIQVSQPQSIRRRLAAGIAWRTVLPMFVLLPFLGIATWIIVGRGLQPLAKVASAVKQRNPGSLEPVVVDGLPDELQPVVSELNTLLERLDHALDAQRAFTADAAHELRTPLTALQLQLELAQNARKASDREAAFLQLEGGMRRAIRLVNQLLTLARQEPGRPDTSFVRVDLNVIAKRVLAEQDSLAAARDIDLGMTRDEPACTDGDGESISVLIGNLVDNAIRYTPDGGRVDVAVYRDGDRAVVEVSDTGPGIPEEERERVFDRFYRRAGNEVPGSGLGLAIVQNIARRHHASVDLHDNPDGAGLLVRVGFPGS
ncbi:MAG: HAMP domain-containing protein [Betaproteobacteria bacterium]|nr:HAMP domain-containing protein [Betaproteobacteria bacterium]